MLFKKYVLFFTDYKKTFTKKLVLKIKSLVCCPTSLFIESVFCFGMNVYYWKCCQEQQEICNSTYLITCIYSLSQTPNEDIKMYYHIKFTAYNFSNTASYIPLWGFGVGNIINSRIQVFYFNKCIIIKYRFYK